MMHVSLFSPYVACHILKGQFLTSLHFYIPCHMPLTLMLYVEFKKYPWCPMGFRGQVSYYGLWACSHRCNDFSDNSSLPVSAFFMTVSLFKFHIHNNLPI